MSRTSAPTSHAGVLRKLATSTVAQPVKKPGPRKLRSPASVIMRCVRSPHDNMTNGTSLIHRTKGIETMHLPRMIVLLLAAAGLATLSPQANAQFLDNSSSSGSVAGTTATLPDLTYVRPTEKTKLRNYFFDAYGPYPIVGAAIAAGINQADNAPPEWRQGFSGYSKRFASDFGIVAMTITTRYALAQAFREDTLYYRCECKGVFPRLRHAALSTFTARRGEDGHRVFSKSAVVAPYAGTMTAVYAWYPGRYDAKDAFRMGNYSLLAYVGGNVALEFLYSGPHSLLSRMHLNNTHGAPSPSPSPNASSSPNPSTNPSSNQ